MDLGLFLHSNLKIYETTRYLFKVAVNTFSIMEKIFRNFQTKLLGKEMRKITIFSFISVFLLISTSGSFCAWATTYSLPLSVSDSLPVERSNPSRLNSAHTRLTVFSSSGKVVEVPIGQFGECVISLISVKDRATVFVNDLRGGDKVDILLRNFTLLNEHRYLSNGHVRVIILSGFQLRGEYYAVAYEEKAKAAKREVSEQIILMNGAVLGECNVLPFIFAEVPYENVFKLAENVNVAHIFLDKRYYVCLNESVPLIKPPSKWAGIESSFGYAINGGGVRIAVLDTGIDKSHPDLDDVDDKPDTRDPKVIAEMCFTDENHTWDGYGHGTHCASIAAGTGEASNYKFVGVAPGAFLLNGKVLTDEGWGRESWIIRGIEWAVGEGADVISMSLGADINGDGTDPLSIAVDWAVDQGVVCVVAAGNAGWGGMFTVGIPAVSRKAITVGATTKADKVADFSSQGPTADLRLKPDVCAPGVNIIAARAKGTSMGTPINEYYTMASGTSMATPHVAGAAALIIQAHPNWNPTMVKSALMGQAKMLDGEPLWRQGAGRIDVCESVNATLLIVEPSISFGTLGLGDTANVTFTIINVANFSTTLNVSTTTLCEGKETNYVSVNVTSLIIPAYDNASILLQAGPLDEYAPEGWYEGFLNASTAQDSVKSPYLFGAFSTLTTYLFDVDNKTPIYAMELIASYPDLRYVDFSEEGTGAKFYLKSGNYSILTQSAWIETRTDGNYSMDFSRAFMLQKTISVPKLSSLNVSISLSEAKISIIPTVDLSGNNLTVHAYTQYFCGGPQEWHDYFFLSEWSIGSGWFGYDLNVSHLTFYSTEYTPSDRLCEALGYYASNNLLSEVYLMPFKFWNVPSLPDVISYSEPDLARYYVFYDVPETYPENGLNSLNAFWFTSDHLGSQAWAWDVHSVYAGINATYYLAPGNATYWGNYMPTYKGWSDYELGPLQEWSIGRHHPYPQIPLEKGETGSMVLGRFSFAPYQPGLSLNVSSLGNSFLVNLTGDVWRGLSWPYLERERLMVFPPGIPSPYPQFYATYRVYVDQVLFDEGKLNGKEGYNGEPYIHYPPHYLDVDWKGICKTWNITGGKVTLIVDMPSLAFLSTNSSLKMNFLLGQSDSVPPTIKSISYPLNYSAGAKIRVTLNAEDQGSGIKDISLLYSFDNMDWFEAEHVGDGVFEFKAQEKDTVAVKVIIEDYMGNTLEYETYPLAVCSSLILKMEGGLFNPGQPLHGSLTTPDGNPINGFAVLLSYGQFSGYVPSANFSYESPKTIGETAVISARFQGSNLFLGTARRVYVTSTKIILDNVYISDYRADVGSLQCIAFHAFWAHNNSDVVGGTIYVNGSAHITNGTGWVTFNVCSLVVGKQLWTVTGVLCHGVTGYEKAVEDPYIIWDKVVFNISVVDDRINVGEMACVEVSAYYAYDGAPFKGTYSFNDTLTKSTVGRYGYTISSITDNNYGLTVFECNAVSVIFDKVVIDTFTVEDFRINIGDTASFTVGGYYAYDGVAWSGGYSLNDTATKSVVGKYGYRITSITDSNYGLTVFEQTAPDIYVIFDKVKIILSVADDRINVGDTAQFSASGVYEYDNTPWSGTYTLNDTATKTAVGKYGYKILSITDDKYGLTAFVQTPPEVSVIFDKLSITLSTHDDRINVGSTATINVHIIRLYDSSVSGATVTLNDTLTKSTVGKYAYTVSSVSGDEYGITAFESNSISIIFDKIVVVESGVSDELAEVGEKVTVWFKAVYAYDSAPFDSTRGILYVNGEPAEWSEAHGRWEYMHKEGGAAKVAFTVTALYSKLHNPVAFEDHAGSQVVRWVYLKPLYEVPVVGNAVQQLDYLFPGYGSVTLIGTAAVILVAALAEARHLAKRKLNKR